MESKNIIKGRSLNQIHTDCNGNFSANDKFEANFGMIGGFSFGFAIIALKDGCKVCRSGWNGKGMWLKYINGVFNDLGSNDYGDAILLSDLLPKEMYIKPWIGMKCADNEFVPWLASQTDILAEDWMLYSDPK